MISDTQKLASVKRWAATLVVGPNTYALTDLPSRTLGQDQQRGTCTMPVSSFPDELAGAAAYVDVTLNGESERYFTGKVDTRPIADNPTKYEISLIDTLGRLDKKLDKKLDWRNVEWVTAVRDLLHKAGITDPEIVAIFDPGTNFKLGSVYTIHIDAGTTIESLLRDLMSFAGTDMRTDPDGRVRVLDSPGWPETTPTIVYAYGASKFAGEFGHTGARRTLGGSEDRIKSFKAKGPRRPDKQIPDATFTVTGMTNGKYEEQEYKYLQTENCAKEVASREIVRRNRQSTEVEVNAPLNPTLAAGDTIAFRDGILGFFLNTPALILAVSNTGHTMTMRLSVGAKPPDGTITVIPPPVANFTMKYEQQPITIAGAAAVRVLVEATDTSSDPSGFAITSWEWAAEATAGVEPQTSNERNAQFIFNTLDGAKLTLTVESASGEGNSKTKNVEPTTGEVFTRCLSAATDDGWYVLAGASGWRKYGSDCTAVPGINDSGPLIAGFSDGTIMLTEDMLANTPTTLATLDGGAVRCLFVNEGNPMEMLAGVGSNLFRSSDGGFSWTLLFTFEDDINYAESSVANANVISVCAGRFEYWNGGGSDFSVLLTGPVGSTCRKLASAPWGHLVVWSGTETISDAYKFEEGYSLDWSGVPPAAYPIDLSSVTPLQYEAGYLLTTGAANDIVRDGLYQQLAYMAMGGDHAPIYKVTQGAGGFVVEYRATATTSGVNKVVNHANAYAIAEPETCFRVGYGQPTEAPEPPEIVIMPNAQSGGADKLFQYKQLVGWQPKDPPIAGAAWAGIVINHINPAQWIIWVGERAFYTGNMGFIWTEIHLPKGDGGLRSATVRSASFIGIGAKWVVLTTVNSAFGVGRSTQAYYVKGDGASAQFQKSYGDPIVPPAPTDPIPYMLFWMIPGLDGKIGGVGNQTPASFPSFGITATPEKQYVLDGNTLAISVVGDSDYILTDTRLLDGNAALACWSANVGKTPNFATTLPTPVIAAGGSAVEAETGVFVGDRRGIAQIIDFDVAPVVAVLAGGDTDVGRIVRGRNRRGMAALSTLVLEDPDTHVQFRRIFCFNGIVWTAVDTPVGVAISPAIGLIEV